MPRVTLRDLTQIAAQSQVGRVLVIGLSSAVVQGIVEPLRDLGVAAQASTQPEQASQSFDARDFEVIVFGRMALGPMSDRLKRDFSGQNPAIRFVDAISPVAVKQTLAALAHDPSKPRFCRDVRVIRAGADALITATIVAPCGLVLTIYRTADRKVVADVVGTVAAKAGSFAMRIDASRLAIGDTLLLTANKDEYHLRPVLDW